MTNKSLIVKKKDSIFDKIISFFKSIFHKKVDSKEMNSYYTFLPVWRYIYRYQGTNYEFFQPGQ